MKASASGATDEVTEEQKIEQFEVMVEEMREREARKLNLIIFNFDESSSEETEDRKKHDEEVIRKLLATLETPVPFSKVIRLGKPESTPRPIRISTASVKDQQTILRAAVKLKDIEEYKNIYVNRDQTPQEQKNWKRLQEAKKKKIQEAEEQGLRGKTYIIRKGKVVEGRGKKE